MIVLLLIYIFASMFLLESPPPEYFRREFKLRKEMAERASKKAVPKDLFAFSDPSEKKEATEAKKDK